MRYRAPVFTKVDNDMIGSDSQRLYMYQLEFVSLIKCLCLYEHNIDMIRPNVYYYTQLSILFVPHLPVFFFSFYIISLFFSSRSILFHSIHSQDFVVSGTCTSNLHGMCESLYRPDLSPDELFEGR